MLGVAVALTTLHLHLVWRSEHPELLEPSLLCWAAAWFVAGRREWGKLDSGLAATSLGIVAIAWILLRSASVTGYDSFLRFAPIVSGFGLALLASGFGQLKHYWRELAILGFIAIPTTSLMAALDISRLTADFASNLLWYGGYPVTQQGVNLIMPTGTVEVYPGCSGISLIFQLLTLTFIFVMLFPLSRLQSAVLPIIAISIGFFVNGIRVALMAILFAQAKRDAFEYWHLGTGSLIFSLIAVALLGGVCYYLLEQAEPSDVQEGAEL
nr:cyanoexosortase A [Myxacorys almedinensis]